jgi:hypothetical protein
MELPLASGREMPASRWLRDSGMKGIIVEAGRCVKSALQGDWSDCGDILRRVLPEEFGLSNDYVLRFPSFGRGEIRRLA